MKVVLPCVAVGVLTSFSLEHLPGSRLAIWDVASVGVSFATASLALCLTVLVLIIALPGQNRVEKWARNNRRNGASNSYTELVFAVLWAAVTQLGFLICCFINLIFGGDIPIGVHGMWPSHRFSLFLSFALLTYSISELYSVLATVCRLAVVMVKEARSDMESDSNGN